MKIPGKTEGRVACEMVKLGKVISADFDTKVWYSKLGNRFTVTKALYTCHSDSEEMYQNEIKIQTLLAEKGLAPKLLEKDDRSTKHYVMWTSEDAGLPITENDVEAANSYLDTLYDMGVLLFSVGQDNFLKGWDGKIRTTDFKVAELLSQPITKDKREYIQWKT